jgi:hypothetical protein
LENDIESVDETRRTIRFAAILTLLLCAAGVGFIWLVERFELWRRSMFFEHFAANEGAGIAIMAVAAIALFIAARRAGESEYVAAAPDISRRAWIYVAAGVFLIVLTGTFVIFRNYAFVDDEYSGLFQATVYAHGQSVATVPAPWCEFIVPLTPTSIASDGCTWRLAYFPVNALIRAGFMTVKLGALAHPIMAALSVLVVMDMCRRAWPEHRDRPIVAGLFLATSSQLLLMSMTAFSMPAHLLMSAIWLWVYIRPERWALVILPVVGVIALGVHSPYPHVLFVAPLIVRYLVQRRFLAFAYVSAVYAAGSIAWVNWLRQPAQTAADSVASAQGIAVNAGIRMVRPAGDAVTAAMSTVILGTWNVPIALTSVLVAMLLWKRLDNLTRWLAASFIFTLFARAIFFGTYGAGWGHRYVYAALANFAILAAAGVELISEPLGARRTRRLAAISFFAAVMIQLPLRGMQARGIITPYVRASQFLETVPADVVVVQFEALQWGRQLLRNDPFLRNSPKLMSLSDLGLAARDSLERMFPGRVRFVRREEIEALGVKRASRIGRFEIR